MATLIICPACDTRYETAAVFPPEGRKVRCSKCAHVWQAVAVSREAAAAGAPRTAAPQAPKAPAAARPAQPAPPRPGAGPANTGLGGFAGIQSGPKVQPSPPPPPPQGDADFDGGDLAGRITQYNSDALGSGQGAPPPPADKPGGGLFARLTGKRSPAAAPPQAPSVPPPGAADQSLAEAYMADAAMGDAAMGDAAMGGGDLDAGRGPSVPPFDTIPPRPEGESRKPPVLALGWGALLLVVGLVLGLLLLAPATVMSVVPGAARLYSLLGMPVGAHGLAFQGVRYGWTNEGGQTVLEVQGDVVNNSSAPVEVPTVVIALRDENGEEISEWTTEVGESELGAGEHAPFLRQIPSPPSNVRSVKVHFAKTEE